MISGYYDGTGSNADLVVKVTDTDGASLNVTIPVGDTTILNIKLSISRYVYNKKTKTPSVTVKDAAGTTLKNGKNYTVKYPSERKNVGQYTYTITFKGNYSGTAKASFQIVPKTAGIKSVKVSKKKLTAKAKSKPSSLGGKSYQFAYMEKGTSTWKYTTTSSSSKTIKKLKKGKQYYFKARAYKKVGKVT